MGLLQKAAAKDVPLAAKDLTAPQRAQQLPQDVDGAEFDAILKRLDDGDDRAWDDYYALAERNKARRNAPTAGRLLKLPY